MIYLVISMKKFIYIIISASFLLFAQPILAQKYPSVILPGEQKLVAPKIDTLWILKDSQLKRAIISAKKLKIEEEINAELHKKVSLLESKSLIQDSLITDLKEDRDFYTNKWEVCSQDVDILIKKNKRQKVYTKISLAGIVVAFFVGFLIK